ncbi:MAG TPA: pitrilysin family protein [Haloplasmataceae bacterium]
MTRTQLSINGMNVVIIQTEKFKTTDLHINFRNLLTRDTVTKRAILPNILRSGSKHFPSKQAISRELERLYGASLSTNVNKIGRQQVLSFHLSLVNDAYLAGESELLDDAFRLIGDILFQPKVENDAFDEKIVQVEKRLMDEYFESLYDNKIRYGFERLLEHMYADEEYKLQAHGVREDLSHLNPNNLYETYQKMLEEDAVDFLLIGDVDLDRVKNLIEKTFPTFSPKEDFPVLDLTDKEIRDVKEVEEYQDINQAKLNIGFRTYTRGLDPDYVALQVLNGMLGGYPHSLLFKNVREKNSLCYYITSTLDRAKGAMYIYSGIAPQDYKKALDLTLEQLETIKKGEFTEELLVNTKNAMINDLLEMNDSPSRILTNDFTSLLYGEVYDVNKRIERIKAVTYQDVVNVAQKITLDTIFNLTQKGVSV